MSFARPRTIVTADPELDDLNSLIRLLLYTNEIDVQGLIYASSRFHWRGDGRGTQFFLPEREYVKPQTSWRWAPGERFIHDTVDAYAQVYNNLVVHDSRYPEPDALRSVVRFGNVDFEGDLSEETSGSNLIVAALLDEDPRPLHLQLWAGPSTVARALLSIEQRFSDHDDWIRIHREVSAKAVITKFASQDGTYDDYILPRWPGIRVTDVATSAWGYGARDVVRDEDAHLLGAEWMKNNVTTVGPLGALYRVWGDGRQMVPGDITDYFHLSGFSADELRDQGYMVWLDPQPAGQWISEGDTTNMLNLIVPSLRGHEHPSYGGWGGRAVRTDIGHDTWAINPSTTGRVDEEASVTRWFATAQADFAIRLKWSVTPRFENVNHHPKFEVQQGTDLEVAPGDTIRLSAVVSETSGDTVEFRWWIYEDAGTSRYGAALSPASGIETSVAIPTDATLGDSIHVVVEARDQTEQPLTAYQRVILRVRT